MGNLDLGTGDLKAGTLTVPGLNLATNFIPLPNPKAGEWWCSPSSGAASSAAVTQSAEYATPIFVTAAGTISALGAEVTVVAASSVVRLGVRADDGTGNINPGTLLLDAGTIDTTTGTGFKQITGLSLAVTPGVYWLTATAQGGAPTMRTIASPGYWLCTSNAAPQTSLITAYLNTGITGALASPWAGTRTGSSSGIRVFALKA